MSKTDLKSAIQNLKINTPFDLRKQGQVSLTAPQVEVPQIKEPQFQVPAPEPAQSEVTQSKPSRIELPRPGGYFRLAHAVFIDPELRKLSGDAFRLFLWMSTQAWRFQDSDGTLRASISFMETATGISHATISRCLSQLKASGLVELIRTDFKKGNLWRVSNRAKDGSDPEGPQTKGTQKQEEAASNRVGSSQYLREKAPQNEGEIRTPNSFQQDPKNSLSEAFQSETIASYFETLKPARKRESELQAFRSLKADFSERQILDCLEYLNASGLPESGQACHSPMAYLSKAMLQVLQRAEASRGKRLEASERAKALADQTIKLRTHEETEEREAQVRRDAFLKAHPTAEAQAEAIARVASRFPMFNPAGSALRNLAVSEWWIQNGQSK